MRALVVGAGVVGQVHGRHLARGGADVAFLVKPEHRVGTQAGLTLYPLNRPRRARAEPERFVPSHVHADIAEVAGQRWDQVYLTMSSPALRDGSWFAELARAVGEATFVLLQPGPEDRSFVVREVPEERVVQGIITLIGYPAPLPGETRFPRPGVAYWFPPLAPSPLSGPRERTAAVVEALRRGGLPARRARDVDKGTAFGAAYLLPLIAALESAGWRLDELRRRDRMALGVRASREAMAIVARRRGERPPVTQRLAARLPVARTILRLAPRFTPFDLESYLRVHFTKVGDQTRDVLGTYVAWGAEEGLPTEALRRVTPTGRR